MEIITASELYWITRLDAINGVAIGITCIGSILAAISTVAFIMNRSMANIYTETSSSYREYMYWARLCKRTLLAVLPFLLLSIACQVFVPTTKEMCAIKVIPTLANNQEIQGVGDDALQLARDWIKELSPKSTPSAK